MAKIKHGHSMSKMKSKEYAIWADMKKRCYNKNVWNYYNYGGRGIIVCDKWRNDFSAFITDMGSKPSQDSTIDRIDVNGNYEPNNCRWLSKTDQSRNRRNSVYISHNNETLCASQFASKYGIKTQTLIHRIRMGWDLEKALTAPIKRKTKIKNGNV